MPMTEDLLDSSESYTVANYPTSQDTQGSRAGDARRRREIDAPEALIDAQARGPLADEPADLRGREQARKLVLTP